MCNETNDGFMYITMGLEDETELQLSFVFLGYALICGIGNETAIKVAMFPITW